MNMKKLGAAALTAITVVIATACTNTETPEPSPTVTADPATLVVERYGDCLAAVEATTPVSAGNIVTATIEGAVLTWNVAVSNTGAIITLPDDDTDALFEASGCYD